MSIICVRLKTKHVQVCGDGQALPLGVIGRTFGMKK